jgi:hypothetical protein
MNRNGFDYSGQLRARSSSRWQRSPRDPPAFRPRAKERQGTQRISFGDEHLKTNFKSIPLRTSAYLCVMLAEILSSGRRQKSECRIQKLESPTPTLLPKKERACVFILAAAALAVQPGPKVRLRGSKARQQSHWCSVAPVEPELRTPNAER